MNQLQSYLLLIVVLLARLQMSMMLISGKQNHTDEADERELEVVDGNMKRHFDVGREWMIKGKNLILTLSLKGNIQPTINFYNIGTGHVKLDAFAQSISITKRKKNNLLNSEYVPPRLMNDG